jgi:D-alanine--poly(phosphoribitol) ligase subunit 1
VTVYERIAEFAGTDRVAVRCGGSDVTYRELYASALAWRAFLLREYGDAPNPVVIYGHKNPLLLACILGCSLAGRAYVPIDVTFPKERVDSVLRQVSPRVTVDFTRSLPPRPGTDIICGERVREILSSRASDAAAEFPAPAAPRGGDICYILFTSGSTGEPKGVAVSFDNVAAFLRAFGPVFTGGAEEGDLPASRAAVDCHSWSFDLSWGYIYPSLYYGYTLFSLDGATIENSARLFEALRDSKTEIMMVTPSFAEMCTVSANFNRDLLPSLRRFIFCGETLTNALARELRARFDSADIINTYGPTECTVLVTAVRVDDEMARSSQPLPVGRALEGIRVYAADETGAELPGGQTGELRIVGPTVGLGYYGRTDLTEASFFIDAETGLRGYATGDMGFCADGMAHFRNRRDLQIKLNGYRLELGDVEGNLLRLPYIARAAVVPAIRNGKAVYLTAYIVLKPDAPAPSGAISSVVKRDLAKYAASYMTPRKIVVLDALPLNNSGKTDRAALARLGEHDA